MTTEELLRKLQDGDHLSSDELVYLQGQLRKVTDAVLPLGSYGASLFYWSRHKLDAVEGYLRARKVSF